MDGGLPDRIERDVLHADEADWLKLWAHQGWLVVGDPLVSGHSADGDAVHRFTLARTPKAEWTPSLPWIEPDVARLPFPEQDAPAGPPTAWTPRNTGRTAPSFLARLASRRQVPQQIQLDPSTALEA